MLLRRVRIFPAWAPLALCLALIGAPAQGDLNITNSNNLNAKPEDYSEAGGASLTQPQVDRVIFTDSKMKPYNQADLYREGVQTLSTAVLFTVNQIQEVQTIRARNDGNMDYDLKRVIGKTFCGPDSGTDCAQRFLTEQEPILRQYRAAIAQDQAYAGRLQDGAGVFVADKHTAIIDSPPAAKPGFQAAPSVDENRKAPPKAKTLAALRADYAEHESDMLAGITNETLVEKNAIEILETKPVKEQFIKLVKVPRDPAHPESGDLYLQKLNSDGTAELDEKAFKEAMADWNRRNEKDSQGKSLANKYEETDRKIAESLGKNTALKGKGRLFEKLVEGGERDTYLRSQHTVVEQTNKQLGIGPKRTPAAGNLKQKGTTKNANPDAAPADLGKKSAGQSGTQSGGLLSETEQVDIKKPNDKLIDVYYAPEEIDALITPDFIPDRGLIPGPSPSPSPSPASRN